MKRLVYLIIIGIGGWLAYDYVTKHPEIIPKKAIESAIPPKDSQGRLLVDCPKCNATGVIKCTAPKCKDGKVICPGPCMKLSEGRWEKLKIAGHDPEELWQTFREKGGTQSWSQAHLGEVVEMKDGKAINVGKCKICLGTTMVNCKVCAGTGEVTCSTCKGEKHIADPSKSPPVANDPSPTPSLPPAPTPAPVIAENIHLKDGHHRRNHCHSRCNGSMDSHDGWKKGPGQKFRLGLAVEGLTIIQGR